MSTTAGPALVEALASDVDRLCEAEPAVRQDLPDSVHSMRVATRRLRSVLKSYRRILRRKAIGETTDELRWLAGLLGVARDAEVRAQRFAALLGEQATAFDGETVPLGEKSTPEKDFGAELVAAERRFYAGAHRAVVDAFDSRRYHLITARLHALVSDPPLRAGHAEQPAADVFAAVLRSDFRDLRRLVRNEPPPGAPDRIDHLHEIRKAAKRLRYSAEAAVAVLGDPAAQLARNAKKLQGVLGDHRDAVEALETLRTHAEHTDESGFQRMCDAEEAAAAKALEQYPAAIEFLRHHPLTAA
ncbi:CHAD domain-containing protein [Nocardia yamanashiensis]|uniref:CHAD domain-containing protein n=1 Tax=Nocardia yamanashiensis TaxID=209247 RepID=UPI001E5DF37A|nr:CHAD domain-containing protein [Nocardia yamanashiensis]UGT45083.1 CHAD domain-containing protein [Nocardia yamanashiensis]